MIVQVTSHAGLGNHKYNSRVLNCYHSSPNLTQNEDTVQVIMRFSSIADCRVLKCHVRLQGFLDKVGSHFWRFEWLKLTKIPFLRIPILSRMNQQVFGTIPFLASSLFQMWIFKIANFNETSMNFKFQWTSMKFLLANINETSMKFKFQWTSNFNELQWGFYLQISMKLPERVKWVRIDSKKNFHWNFTSG